MAKKKDKTNKLESEAEVSGLKTEMKHTIWGIVSALLALVLILASRDLGGSVGSLTYRGLHYLLGTGYYLLPVAFIFLAISFFRLSRPKIVAIRILGLVLFISSGLGIMQLAFHEDTAGLVGWAVGTAGEKLFGVASWVVFIAILLISLVLVFETSLSLTPIFKLFKRKESKLRELASVANTDDVDNEEDESADENDEDLVEAVEEEPKKPARGLFGRKKEVEEPKEEFVPLVRADISPYTPPPIDLLRKDSGKPAAGDIKANSNIIKRTLV